MMDVTIEDIGNSTYLVSSYNREFPPKARRIGGKWDAARRAWRFDIRDRARVEKLAGEFFGWAPGDTNAVTVRIDAYAHIDKDDRSRVTFAGRTVARRISRDADVVLAENAVVVDGAFPASGGSIANPAIGDCNAILELRDIPSSSLANLVPDSYRLVDADPRAMLEAEREALLSRIAEIDRQLEAMA